MLKYHMTLVIAALLAGFGIVLAGGALTSIFVQIEDENMAMVISGYDLLAKASKNEDYVKVTPDAMELKVSLEGVADTADLASEGACLESALYYPKDKPAERADMQKKLDKALQLSRGVVELFDLDQRLAFAREGKTLAQARLAAARATLSFYSEKAKEKDLTVLDSNIGVTIVPALTAANKGFASADKISRRCHRDPRSNPYALLAIGEKATKTGMAAMYYPSAPEETVRMSKLWIDFVNDNLGVTDYYRAWKIIDHFDFFVAADPKVVGGDANLSISVSMGLNAPCVETNAAVSVPQKYKSSLPPELQQSNGLVQSQICAKTEDEFAKNQANTMKSIADIVTKRVAYYEALEKQFTALEATLSTQYAARKKAVGVYTQ